MGVLKIETNYGGPAWSDLTDQCPWLGYPLLGLPIAQTERVAGNGLAIARFGLVEPGSRLPAPGEEIRITDATTGMGFFAGIVTQRERVRLGPNTGARYSCQDYNVLLDRTVIDDYTIDAGDTDSTEIQTLLSTYLPGVAVGYIMTLNASLEEIHIQGTFRQALEAIAAQAGGAYFYVSQGKSLYYVDDPSSIPGMTGAWNLTDDIQDAFDMPYGQYYEREDESQKIDQVYVVGDGVEGWYPDPPTGEYQAIVHDTNVTTQDGIDAVGAALIDAYGDGITERRLVCWDDPAWEYKYLSLTHSHWVPGGEFLWVRRAVMRPRNDTGSEREYEIELGHQTVDRNNLGGGNSNSPARGPIFGADETEPITPDDPTEPGVSRFAARADHQHGFAIGIPGPIGTSDQAGVADTMNRSDHIHSHPAGLGANLHHNQVHVLATNSALGPDHTISGATAGHVLRATSATAARFMAIQASDVPSLGGTPALTFSTSNAGGSAATYVRTDAQIHLFNTSDPDILTPDQTGDPGTAVRASRHDHQHAISCAAPTGSLTESSTNTEGNATTFARSNHTHALDLSASYAPINAPFLTVGGVSGLSAERYISMGNGLDSSDGGANGAYTVWLGTPSTLNVTSTNGTTATSHTHQVTSSNNPGAGQSILATDTNGQVQIRRLGIGTTSSQDNSIEMVDDAWIGLAYNGPRFRFQDTGTDRIEVMDTDLDFTTSGKGFIHTDGNTAGWGFFGNGTRFLPRAIQASDLPSLGGTPALSFSTSNAAGSASTYVRTDATIALFDGNVPDVLTPDQSGNTGSASVAARRDHVHSIATAAPSSNLSFSSGNSEGSGAYFARADHSHAITTSNNPGTTSAILASNSGGGLALSGTLQIAEYVAHLGDIDTYVRFRDDRLTLAAGAVNMVDCVEAATNYVALGAQLRMGGRAIFLDADNDTYLYTMGVDDQLGLYVGGSLTYNFTASALEIGQAGSTILEIRTSGNVAGAESDIWGHEQLGLSADRNVGIFIDCDDSTGTNNFFAVLKDDDDFTLATEVFRIQEDGRMGIGTNSPGAIGHFVQDDTGGNIPVLRLDQDDNDRDFISLVGTGADGNKTRCLVSEDDSGVSGMVTKGYFKVYIQDDGNRITDGYYHVAFGTLN